MLPLSGYRLLAQQASASGLIGWVRDASGSPVDGAKVTAWSEARKEVTRTDAEGRYALQGLPAGDWNVTVLKEGFAAQEVKGLRVEASGLRYDPVLQIGNLVETVNVNADPPSPPTDFQGKIIQIGQKVQAAKILSRVAPLYPQDCKAERVQGVVLLQAIIGREGMVESVTQMNQLVDARLARAAMEAVRQWRYQTTLLNGQPVAVLTEVEVNFTLAP
jgi:TonB family protein